MSERYHHGTVNWALSTFYMVVEKNGSGYLLFCSNPANTVERDETGSQPVVGKPGWVMAESSETCAEVCNRKPGIAAAVGAAAVLGRAPAAGIAVRAPATSAVASNQWGKRSIDGPPGAGTGH